MINITKYYKDESTVEYELEVTKENKIIFSTKVEMNKDKNTDNKVCDRLAKIKLLHILMENGIIEIDENI